MPPCLPISYPLHLYTQLPLDHQAVVSLSPVLLRLLPAGGGEVLHTSTQRLLHKNPMSPGLPGVKSLFNPPLYSVGSSYMTGYLQYHCLEDNKLLQVPLSVPYPTQILPTWCVVATLGHDREVTPPPRPHPVV